MECYGCGRPLVNDTERANSLCHECVAKVKTAPIPDPRPRVPCRGCGHTILLRTQLFDQNGELATTRVAIAVAAPDIQRSVWTGQVRAIVPGSSPTHQLVAYVCRGCGLTELYTSSFAELPVGPHHGTALIDVGGATEGPYR